MLVETVGSGQNEVEVQSLTETVVLALMPGSGDGVQAIKAGLMEIPDVLAVTKADRAGADALVADLSNALSLVPGRSVGAADRARLGAGGPAASTTSGTRSSGTGPSWARRAGSRRGAATASRASFTRWRPTAWRGGWRPPADAAFLDGLIDEVMARRVDPAGAVNRVLERAGLPPDAAP